MREPNFSESQLQQAANMALVRRIFEARQDWIFPFVPSLVAEADLGWDSAFFMPWVPLPPQVDHEGCNLFIQYKLSIELTSPGAGEWAHWGCQYLRFKIPHRAKDPTNGQYYDDYHQWEQLSSLAGQGYPTFYATNSTLERSELNSHFRAGTLCEQIPVLDIRPIQSLHKHVTFTSSSSIFCLHSEKTEAYRATMASMLKQIAEIPALPLSKLNDRLMSSLSEVPHQDKGWHEDLERIRKYRDDTPHPKAVEWQLQLQVAAFVRRHVGAFMFWVPIGRPNQAL